MRIGAGSFGYVVSGVFLLGCTDLPLVPADQDRLDAAEHQWAARGFTNYSIDMVHFCDCPPSFRDRARIEVVGGTVHRVTLLRTLTVITDSRRQAWRTVEDVFNEIHAANTLNTWEHVTFSLDPILGVPTYVHWAAKPGASERELIIQISNPQPLSSLPLPK